MKKLKREKGLEVGIHTLHVQQKYLYSTGIDVNYLFQPKARRRTKNDIHLQSVLR